MSKLYVDEIASKTGGTDALTIDSSGRILTPARPVLLAQGNVNSDVVYANNADITFATSGVGFGEFAQGGMSLVSNTQFTVPITGLYQFQASVYVNDSHTAIRLQLAVNGNFNPTTTIAGNAQSGDAASRSIQLNHVLNLTAGDYVSIKNASGGNRTFYNGYNHTYAFMYLIG
jgi:hypothetical protein